MRIVCIPTQSPTSPARRTHACGCRYADREFKLGVINATGLYEPPPAGGEGDPGRPAKGGPGRSFVILTMANDAGMQLLMPTLLGSLQRIEHPVGVGGSRPLTAFTVVVGATHPAFSHCQRLTGKYNHTCLPDQFSGLHDGQAGHMTHQALAFGFMKVRCGVVRAVLHAIRAELHGADTTCHPDRLPLHFMHMCASCAPLQFALRLTRLSVCPSPGATSPPAPCTNRSP